ncbi:NADH-quinone oxidoreductase subunit E [Methylobacterium sp. Leaf102]|uniref:NADH-quinone oxidoreductase subunit NuoE n=1 Tax=Methylobacterium sp. Leaf102 TaxID=1736253 RepID=UPI0006F454D2|nr:NADH-quinone oxidoreductase subunit NuoE [Methylobacterium sp. Leaf102]KQP34359.1 NADH-quinone oxidoreductase subunit E [Methylobacterium sp. Leaf102]
MANRRLAPAAEQPQSFAFSSENAEWAKGQIEKYPEGRQASAVIPLLWKAQEQNGGWLPRAAIESVADELGMPHIRVLEVATFYTMFALEPVGRFWIQLCGTVPCDSCGARELKDYLQARLGAPGHVSADGNFSWLEVECLGACCNAPMAQINQDYYEDLTPDLLGALMDDLAAGRPVKIGSQVGRTSSEPKGGADTLVDATLFDGSRVGAWRQRFEDKKAEESSEPSGKAEAASSEQRAAADPKPARPDAGRAVEGRSTDAPAQRSASGEKPVKSGDEAEAADPAESTARPGKPAPTPAESMARAEAAGAEAGRQSDLPRDEPPPQPEASGASEGVSTDGPKTAPAETSGDKRPAPKSEGN